MNGIENI